MRKYKLDFAVYIITMLLVCTVTAVISYFFMSKLLQYRELRYNPAMPILSNIFVGVRGVNYKNAFLLIILEVFIMNTPNICYRITGDSLKSAILCLMPVVLWGVMIYYSVRITMINAEVRMFVISAFLNTIVSILWYLWHLFKEKYSDDFEEEYDDMEDFDYE